LNDLQNSVFGTLLIPSIKLGGIILVYMGVVAATILRKDIHFLILALFLAYLGVTLTTVTFGALLMSQVYNISKKFHGNLASTLSLVSDLNEKILIRKTLVSLPVMKSKIGTFYYMEGKAKLTLLDNIARGIAFMLTSFK